MIFGGMQVLNQEERKLNICLTQLRESSSPDTSDNMSLNFPTESTLKLQYHVLAKGNIWNYKPGKSWK